MQRQNNSKEKIIIFENIRPLMIRLGLHSFNLHDSKNEFFESFGAYYIMFIAIVFMIILSAAFMLGNLSNFEIISEPMLVAIAGFQMFGMFVSLGLNKKNVKVLQLELEALINEGI